MQLSSDHGTTWGVPIIVAKAQSAGVIAPDGTALRTGDNIPDIAVGADGSVYLAWQDSRFAGGVRDDVVLSESHDGGLNWSAPVRVNAGDVPAFNPSVEITSGGRLGVGYHELRGTGVTRLLATRAPGASGFVRSVLAGGAANEIVSAPVARGYFLGDYQGLAAAGERLVSFYVMPNTTPVNPANRTDVVASIS